MRKDFYPMNQSLLFNDTSSSSFINVLEADLNRDDHIQDTTFLINAYAMDPMGNGRPLSEEVRRELIPGLQNHPTTIVFLAYHGTRPVGIAVCFKGFSTFAAKPLINIHDFSVLPDARGLGIAKALLDTIAMKAREMGCCKLTLEVLENNQRAKKIYEAAGFAQARYQEEAGGGLFYAKPL
jgi:ribosomal protein S18 acetylase RimI-like enzyme